MKRKKILILMTLIFSLSIFQKSSAQVSIGISISARIAPPPLPVYVQPACPTDGYLWTPGYWAYGNDGYFWVPGVWVLPPQPGFLWTPSYWGYAGGVYGYHAGYWGPHVGFYGGVNYGYGYGGSGFGGGRWEGGSFRYNTAVVNVNHTVIHNTYVDKTVIVNNTTVINNRTSYNGGPGGLANRPNAQEQSAMNERHVQPTSQQNTHMQTAARDRNQFASNNNGRPATTAMNTIGGHRYNQQGHGSSVNNPQQRNNSQPQHNNNQPQPQHMAAVPAQHNPGQPHDVSHSHNPSPQHNPGQPHDISQPHNKPEQHNMPQQHNIPQQQHNMPQQHNAPQPHAAPQEHAAPPQNHEGEHPKEH